MTNHSASIPVGMLTKKWYCHCCGQPFTRKSRTRTISPGDPDYPSASRMGRGRVIGDVEYTEYDFYCPNCGNLVDYNKQCVIARIQKKTGRPQLTQTELDANWTDSLYADVKSSRLKEILWYCFLGFLTILFLYLSFLKA